MKAALLSVILLCLFALTQPAEADTWVNFTAGNYPKVAVCEGDRYVWVGSDGGVARFDIQTGEKTVYTSADGLCGNHVHSIAIDENGDKWFGAGGGASVLHSDGTWAVYPVQCDRYGCLVQIDKRGNKWLNTGGSGLWLMLPNGMVQECRSPDDHDYIHRITFDEAGNAWIPTGLTGVWVRYTDGTWANYNSSNSGLGHNGVRLIAHAPDGTKWFATYVS